MTKSDLAMTPEQIAETDSVSEALGNFAEDHNRENAVALVRAVMDAVNPAQEDEPVGIVTRYEGVIGAVMQQRLSLKTGDKLYTHPANDDLRRAIEKAEVSLEALFHVVNNMEIDSDTVAKNISSTIDKLKAARGAK
jgi:hypothetical protein